MSDYKGKDDAHLFLKYKQSEFNYGDLNVLHYFNQSHPSVMQSMINKFNWQDKLDDFRKQANRVPHKHEKWKQRIMTLIEEKIMNGEQIFTFKNYKLLKR